MVKPTSVNFNCLFTRFRCKILFQCPHLDLVDLQLHHISHHNLLSVEEFQTKWNCLTATVITKSQGKNICNLGLSSGSNYCSVDHKGSLQIKLLWIRVPTRGLSSRWIDVSTWILEYLAAIRHGIWPWIKADYRVIFE